MAAQPLLVAEGISCVVAERRLFHDLDIAAGAGELVEIRGDNGSGKSTLLRGLAGLHEFRDGHVRRHANCEYLGHRTSMCERLTPLENIRWLTQMRGQRVLLGAVESALARLGLDGAMHELCGTLSAGQQRRAALARVSVSDAPLWLLDEPLTALDQSGVERVRQLVAEHRAAGGSVICATHAPVAAPDDPAARRIVLGR